MRSSPSSPSAASTAALLCASVFIVCCRGGVGLELGQPVDIEIGGTQPLFTGNLRYGGAGNPLVFALVPSQGFSGAGVGFKVSTWTVNSNNVNVTALSGPELAVVVWEPQAGQVLSFAVTAAPSASVRATVWVYEAGTGFTTVAPQRGEMQGNVFTAPDRPPTSAGFRIPVQEFHDAFRVTVGSGGNAAFPMGATVALGVLAGQAPDDLWPVSDAHLDAYDEMFVLAKPEGKPSGQACLWQVPGADGAEYKCVDGGPPCNTTNCCAGRGGVLQCAAGQVLCGSMRCAASCEDDLAEFPRPCVGTFRVTLAPIAPISVSTPSPTSSSSSMSGSAVFLILLFTSLAVYCLCGMVFQWSNGARACPELLPNHRFWMELPSYFMEGLYWLRLKLCGHQGVNTYAVHRDYAPVPREVMGDDQATGLSQSGPSSSYGTANL